MDTTQLFYGLIIAAIFGRAPLMCIVMAALDTQHTNRARYGLLVAAVAVAIAVDGTLLYNFSAAEIFDFLRQMDPIFAWAVGLSLGCAESVLLLPLVARRIKRKPNKIAHTFVGLRKIKLMPGGNYVPARF